jgi:hypothetical protein
MNRNQKILIKQQELEESKDLVLAREFVNLDEKITGLEDKIDAKSNDDVLEEVKNLSEKIDNIPKPKEIPEFPTEMTINNLPDVQKVEVINFPKHEKQETPIINVQAPIVNVEKTELNTEKIESGLKTSNELLKDISSKLDKEEVIEEKKEFEKVTLVDEDGKPVKSLGGGGGGVAKYVYNAQGKTINPATEETLSKLTGFAIPEYDEISISYTGSNITSVVYKLSSVIVATLTLSYTSDNLTSVIKT